MEDLQTGLAKARRQPWLTRSTGVMLGLVLICAGFIGGIQMQKAYGGSGQGGGQATGANRLSELQGQGRGPQLTSQQSPPPAMTGKIKLVDGTTVYVETSDGRIVTVETTATTVVSAQTDLKALEVGATVTVQGSGTDTVTATSITKTN